MDKLEQIVKNAVWSILTPKSAGRVNVIFFPSGLYTIRTHFFDAVVLKSKSAMVASIRAVPSAGAMQAAKSVAGVNALRAASASAFKSKSKRKLNLEIDPLLEVFNNIMFKVHFFKRELKAARASKSLIISLVVG